MDLKLNVPEAKDVKAAANKAVAWFDDVLKKVGEDGANYIIATYKKQEAKKKGGK